jgi:hypothetical protein
MSRTKLVEALESLTPPTPAACLVLLWTYYHPELAKVENELEKAGFRLGRPGRLTPDRSLADCIVELRSLITRNVDFDQFALTWLKRLDVTLKDISPKMLAGTVFEGIDGRRYRVCPRNNFIAETFEERSALSTWAADQTPSMAAYAPHIVLQPAETPNGEFSVTPRSDWCPRHMSRLRQVRERGSLRIMMWPLATKIEYPALDQLRDGPPPAVVNLKDPRNEPALVAEAEAALLEAAKQKVTILMFPELAIPPRVEARVRALLAAQEGESYPLLTVLGLCHACPPEGGADVNEAVLLGPEGTELHRHRKLTRFGLSGGYPYGEGTQTGLDVTVLSSPIGNLALLICLDLLHKGVVRAITNDSLANVLLVPSLSPTTKAHRTRAAALGTDQLASTFVCNRSLENAGPEATSFYRVPSREWGEVRHLPADMPYLLFEL